MEQRTRRGTQVTDSAEWKETKAHQPVAVETRDAELEATSAKYSEPTRKTPAETDRHVSSPKMKACYCI